MYTEQFYRLHVFCCINKRPDGSTVGCCASKGAEDLKKYMSSKCKELGIDQIRVNSSLCLNRCSLGPVMVVYPEGIWYHYESTSDIDEIINEHIINGNPVKRLILDPSQK